MKKILFCVSLLLAGLTSSCIDKNEEVDADSKPSWLGGSIYAELENPDQSKLTGQFTTFLRLVNDLDYAETLSRTGSKTVFPANDEAFQRFFSGDNLFGVHSYEELSDAQKKQLLYTAMLDNALLVSMLPNVSNGANNVVRGPGLKHPVTGNVIDSIQHLNGREDMPKGNPMWADYYDSGIDVVNDSTQPMMVHLTREYMLYNGLTMQGENSDFAILTGAPYEDGDAYVFNDRIINGDVICQNGYIHQMQDVLMPPGNMAQVVRRHPDTQLFSRIVDHFAAPYYSEALTRYYNDWALQNGKPQKEAIYQVRYLSARSNQSSATTNTSNNRTPKRATVSSQAILNYDLGWNQYYPSVAQATGRDVSIEDIGAFFVPNDKAVRNYFVHGTGAYLIDIFGDLPNTEENLAVNLDSLHSKKPQVLASFTKNLLKPSFSSTVPSKFGFVYNDASEVMGLEVDSIQRKSDGKYDITIANNGVVYVMNNLIAPDEYQAVLAPSSVYPDMNVMNWAVQDGMANGDYLGVDFKYYLLAMSANYAFFIPEDSAFSAYYLDPASLGHINSSTREPQPEVLHFYYDHTARTQPFLKCDRYFFDMATGQPFGEPRNVNIKGTDSNSPSRGAARSQLVDILNYHTVVLRDGETIGTNRYYKTKHGGTICVDGNTVGAHVMSGNQIGGEGIFQAPTILQDYPEKNGHAYRLDRIIQPPTQSVYGVLSSHDQFSEFLEACNGFEASAILSWAGISEIPDSITKVSPQDAYLIFTPDYKLGGDKGKNACLDKNVKMFNTYNYTLFAPDNTAMQQAYANGLPRWEDIESLFLKYEPLYSDTEIEHVPDAAEEADMALAYSKIKAIRDFVRYHFATKSVYADNVVPTENYQALISNELGVSKEMTISGGNNRLTVSDLLKGHKVTVDANGSKLANVMTRDYWFDDDRRNATAIETSSFCVVHQISEPLYGQNSQRFDDEWATSGARKKAQARYRRLKANNEL